MIVSSARAQQAEEKTYLTPSEYPQNVYSGDPHVHTSLSMDAAAWGTRLGPDAAYRFVLGKEVTSFKGWRDEYGELHEKVYDIAWSDDRKPDSKTGKLPPVGNSVNVAENPEWISERLIKWVRQHSA